MIFNAFQVAMICLHNQATKTPHKQKMEPKIVYQPFEFYPSQQYKIVNMFYETSILFINLKYSGSINKNKFGIATTDKIRLA